MRTNVSVSLDSEMIVKVSEIIKNDPDESFSSFVRKAVREKIEKVIV